MSQNQSYQQLMNDAIGQIFLATKGVHIPTTSKYQGNKSTIQLAENAQTFSSKRTRLLYVQYILQQTKKLRNRSESDSSNLPYNAHAQQFAYKTVTDDSISKKSGTPYLIWPTPKGWMSCSGVWSRKMREIPNNMRKRKITIKLRRAKKNQFKRLYIYTGNKSTTRKNKTDETNK